MTRFLDVDPVVIDAAWLSPQRWTGFFGRGSISDLRRKEEDSHAKLNTFLIEGVNIKPVVKRTRTVTTNSNSVHQDILCCLRSVLCSSEVVYSSVLVKYFVRVDGVVVIGA
jgi:hypothetical protein